uniref:Uncharacterized protein n=1 Tax=Anguilla anguilla TaxID=7936 RepID=A0A0E9XNT6_ANGAN
MVQIPISMGNNFGLFSL